jgi:hypothetical protein
MAYYYDHSELANYHSSVQYLHLGALSTTRDDAHEGLSTISWPWQHAQLHGWVAMHTYNNAPLSINHQLVQVNSEWPHMIG